jgi:hypothetical protein
MSGPYGTPVHAVVYDSPDQDLEDLEDLDDITVDDEVMSGRSTPPMYSSSEPEDDDEDDDGDDEDDDDDEDNDGDDEYDDDDEDNSDNSSEVSMFILRDSDDEREQEQQQEQRPAVRDMEGVMHYDDDFNVYLNGTNTRVHFYEEEIINGDTVPFTGIVYEPA